MGSLLFPSLSNSSSVTDTLQCCSGHLVYTSKHFEMKIFARKREESSFSQHVSEVLQDEQILRKQNCEWVCVVCRCHSLCQYLILSVDWQGFMTTDRNNVLVRSGPPQAQRMRKDPWLYWRWDCSASPFTCPFPCGYQGFAQCGVGSERCRICYLQIMRGETGTSLQCVCYGACYILATPGRWVSRLWLSSQHEERSAAESCLCRRRAT